MPLRDEIETLRDDSIASLDASHDYFFRTKAAWRIVQQVVREGRKVSIRNQATDSVVREGDLPRLAQEYVTGYLAEATFQHFVSLFEGFLGGFLRLWLNAFPHGVKEKSEKQDKQVRLETVLKCSSKAEIIATLVDEQVHRLQYKSLPKWFEYVEKRVHLGCPTNDEIERLTEIKATRNILVHNKGIANAIYVDKDGNPRARVSVGEKVEVREDYHHESWQLIKQVITDIAEAGVAKASAVEQK